MLDIAVLAPSTGAEGIADGTDMLTGRLVAQDGRTGCRTTPRQVTSTNVMRLGDAGEGKSSGAETIDVLRPFILKGRRAVILDKKPQEAERASGVQKRSQHRFDPHDFRATVSMRLRPACRRRQHDRGCPDRKRSFTVRARCLRR